MRFLFLLLLCAVMCSCVSDVSRLRQTETVSPQARNFIDLNTPPVFDSPLTPATVAPIREGLRAASGAERESLR